MREILFRGKIVDIGKWVEGGYCAVPAPPQCFGEPKDPSHVIICENPNTMADWNMPRQMCMIDVIPETVGQYTGLTDKNGRKIFEGDIIEYDKDGARYEVVFAVENGITKFCSKDLIDGNLGYINQGRDKIVGNIHDNPEFLEVRQ